MKVSLFITVLVLFFISLLFISCEKVFDVDTASFSMQVFPDSMTAISGQRCVLLVTVTDEHSNEKPVGISADASGLEVTVNPLSITQGQVAEVTVVISGINTENTLTVNITGKRLDVIRSKTISIRLIAGEDVLQPEAESIRDKFVLWIASNHPELGITSDTEWTGTIVTPDLTIVANYLFFSEDWELGLSWHVMIAPYDWARIYLRQRFTEDKPTKAFEIASLEAQDQPVAIEPPEVVIR